MFGCDLIVITKNGHKFFSNWIGGISFDLVCKTVMYFLTCKETMLLIALIKKKICASHMFKKHRYF
jgi:hypothetical protein